MPHAVRQRFSFGEYLALEDISPVRHEFADGQVWAMAGGSPAHAAIAMNIGSALTSQLRDRPCQVFGSDLRVRVLATGLATYPDVSVVCGKLELDPDDARGHTVTNPKLVVEVLSPSTEDYDRGEKLAHEKRIEGLDEILLVAHDERRVEHWHRTERGWTLDVVHEGGALQIRTVQCTLAVADVFRDPLA